MTRILFVCLGNICRSPMAEFVMKELVKEKGLEQEFTVAISAAPERLSPEISPEGTAISAVLPSNR